MHHPIVSFRRLATPMACALFTLAAHGASQAQVRVEDPWVRATVAQQSATGLFARLTSAQGGRLVGGSSPLAGVVEIHEMSMDGTTMRMRAIPALELPAGQAVELKPGGHHLMLMDLKQPLKAGDAVTVSLLIETRSGQRQTLELRAEVRALQATKAPDHGAQGHKH